MNLDPVFDLARRIHEAAGPKVVLYVAGGGSEVFPWLLSRGGGSATLLAGRIPYDPADFVAILGAEPGRLVAPRAARGLAMAAFRHGLALRPDLGAAGVVGIGATSKLTRGRDERPDRRHEIHLALQSHRRTLVRSTLLPNSHDRSEQERLNAIAILNLVARARGLDELPSEVGATTETGDDSGTAGHEGLPDLLGGQTPWVAYRLGSAGAVAALDRSAVPRRLILPGSFRPLHDGHLRMAAIAEELVGLACSFELSLFHPAKPPLDYVSIAHRVAGFNGVDGWLLLTDAPTYLEKARLFPGSTFVVGHDTALRILEPRWYGGTRPRDAMLDELEGLGTRLLVFGRIDQTGRFRNLHLDAFADGRIQQFVKRSTQVVAEHQFRIDVSSTTLRLGSVTELP